MTEDEWTKLNLSGNVPLARSETQAAAVKGGAVIFGGYTIAAKTIVDRRSLQNSQYLQVKTGNVSRSFMQYDH